MAYYAVWGKDAFFGGLHGMEEAEVIEAANDEEALEYARELSWNVIYDYSGIYEELEARVAESCEADDVVYGPGSEAEEEIRSEIYEADLDYGAAILDAERLPTLDVQTLTRMFYEDENSFLEKYVEAYI